MYVTFDFALLVLIVSLGSFTIDAVPNTPPKKFATTSEKDRDNWVQNIQSSVDKMIEAKKTKAVERV